MAVHKVQGMAADHSVRSIRQVPVFIPRTTNGDPKASLFDGCNQTAMKARKHARKTRASHAIRI
jgi:hypothetical protein